MSEFESLNGITASVDVPDVISHRWLVETFLPQLNLGEAQLTADTVHDVLLSNTHSVTSEFEMHPGGWRVNVGASLVRSILTTGVVYAGLASIHASEIPLQLVPAVLPLLIDVDRVTISRAERALLIPLRDASVGIEGLAVNPSVLYNRLDPAVRADLNERDFLEFVDHLVHAGHLDNAGNDEVKARPGGKPAWIRVTFE